MEWTSDNLVDLLLSYFTDVYRSFPPSLDYIVTFGLATILAMKYIFLDSSLDPNLSSRKEAARQPNVVETCDGTEPVTQSEVVGTPVKEQQLSGEWTLNYFLHLILLYSLFVEMLTTLFKLRFFQ